MCISTEGTLVHFLMECPALNHTRNWLKDLVLRRAAPFPLLQALFTEIFSMENKEFQLMYMLDPGIHPMLMASVKSFRDDILKQAYYLMRTFLFNMHKEKTKVFMT